LKHTAQYASTKRLSPTGDGFAAAKAALVAAEAEVVAAKKDEEATRIRMEALYGGPL